MKKMGSLFDGIGGFPLAAQRNGIIPVWASEIEKWPIKVTKKHFPNMKHLGDITKINGAEIEPVDIITFGSPCQNLSVAGKQEGLEGGQSCLFYEAIRIIREMRGATNGVYPRFAVWENVPGAFSSNGGQDFRSVLEEILEAEIPMPYSGKWATAGMVRGDGRSVAWRVLDAQYWGVPQRRRRIFLVADFRGQSAPEILFECEGMSGDITESGKEGQGTAAGIGEGVTCPRDGVQGQSGTVEQFMFENHGQDTRYKGPLEVAQTVTATYGMGGNNQPFVVKATRHDRITSLQTSMISYGIQGSMIGRADKNGPQGNGINQEVSFTLNTTDRHAVASRILFEPRSRDGVPRIHNNICSTLTTMQGGQREPCIAQHLTDANQGDNYSVRRLTPIECLRLQGFPDDWLDIDGMSDTQKYKAIGNSLAVPCVEFIMQRIKEVKK